MEQEIKKLKEELKTLKERVNRLDGLDRKYLPEKFNLQLINTINDNMFQFGSVDFSDCADPVDIPVYGCSPENVVLASSSMIAYIHKSDDLSQDILTIYPSDIGVTCNYIIFKTTKIPTSY